MTPFHNMALMSPGHHARPTSTSTPPSSANRSPSWRRAKLVACRAVAHRDATFASNCRRSRRRARLKRAGAQPRAGPSHPLDVPSPVHHTSPRVIPRKPGSSCTCSVAPRFRLRRDDDSRQDSRQSSGAVMPQDLSRRPAIRLRARPDRQADPHAGRARARHRRVGAVLDRPRQRRLPASTASRSRPTTPRSSGTTRARSSATSTARNSSTCSAASASTSPATAIPRC